MWKLLFLSFIVFSSCAKLNSSAFMKRKYQKGVYVVQKKSIKKTTKLSASLKAENSNSPFRLDSLYDYINFPLVERATCHEFDSKQIIPQNHFLYSKKRVFLSQSLNPFMHAIKDKPWNSSLESSPVYKFLTSVVLSFVLTYGIALFGILNSFPLAIIIIILVVCFILFSLLIYKILTFLNG